jgi:pyroglutamyl-peptidase
MTILITAFEPFGDQEINPSEVLLNRIIKDPPELSETLVGEVLKTEFASAGQRICELVDILKPKGVIMMGVDENSNSIALERTAFNMDNARIPDNAGYQPIDHKIEPLGPSTYDSTLPLEQMLRTLTDKGIPSIFSHHAGSYVCNHIFYTARHELNRLGRDTPCGFIHLPPIASVPGDRGLPISFLLSGVKICIRVLSKYLPAYTV